MPIHKVDEKSVLPHIGGSGITVPVRVIADDGNTARVQIEGCGIHLRQGQIHTVPSDQIKPLR
ncbi:hypothetical protein [Streptomyces sp. NPDC058295]|uniref:hypothetical protein n=1 Tax=Streptomyces sp. NPDC058295 TaxID=3346431 RepID=UPI0036EACA0F